MKFTCPKCSMPLSVVNGGAAKCENGHTFDRSKEGYYNLLLSCGGVHGDNKEMVLARREFLNTGAYLPLAERIAALAEEHTGSGALIDVGCGEGYYTELISRALSSSGGTVCGFDISKDAVKRAAKRVACAEFAVATAYKIPAANAAFDTAVNMFSPLALSETHRILRTGGTFIMAIPGKRHLWGLKSAVYESPYENEVKDPYLEGFKLVSTECIAYDIELTSRSDVSALFMMTPYAYRTKREDRERILSLDKLKTEVEFIVFVYKKE